MSMDAGGLAQMTFPNNTNNNNNNHHNPHNPSGNFGMGGSSFSSRGKGAHIKRLSVAPPIDENGVEDNPPPRTSRSHLLAGLRTAPKGNAHVPASAPFDQSRFEDNTYNGGQDYPHSAVAQSFGAGAHGQQQYGSGSMYSQPQQILAPPAWNAIGSDAQMDPEKCQELMHLAAQQKRLELQLANMQAMQERMQLMNFNGQQQQQMPHNPMASLHNQQMVNGMQPIAQPVPNQPGLFSVYYPMTGQQTYVYDNGAQNQQPQQHFPMSPPSSGPSSSPEPETPQSAAAAGWTRQFNPPRQSPSPPQDVAPLPKPSANAYRPGHRKSMSSLNRTPGDGPKSAGPRSSAFPQTPQTGTFGPGMARAGEHPIREPRGPPPMDELLARPTALHEGSKNFASRQRRRAIFNLKRAGHERRGGVSNGANGETSPVSELAALSDADSDGYAGSSHSSKSNLSAIGSENKQWRERSRDANTFAGRVADNRSPVEDDGTGSSPSDRKRMPMLVLTSAKERKRFFPATPA